MTIHPALVSALKIVSISLLCIALGDDAVAQEKISSKPYGVVSLSVHSDSKDDQAGKVESGRFRFEGTREGIGGGEVGFFRIEIAVRRGKDRHKMESGFSIPIEKLQELANEGAPGLRTELRPSSCRADGGVQGPSHV